MKNVVVCCDGTANEFARDKTNVLNLYSTLVQDPPTQVVFYHPGLGTMKPPGALTDFAKRVTRLLGKAIGYGLEADVRDAYVFLMNHFEPGDRLFMFGFSRGAYTVRAVASLLHMYGLIPNGNEPLVPYAIRLLVGINRSKDGSATHEYFELAQGFKGTFGAMRECKPWFVGVWDTVSSVGWVENPLRLPYSADNPDIQYGRHAVAIDERRAFFRANLWRPRNPPPGSGPRDLKQVWFPGVHSDVGGGYAEAESELSKIALQWMLKEASQVQLAVDATKVATVLGELGGEYVKRDPTAKLHNSLAWYWWPAEFLWKRHFDWKRRVETRRMNLGRARTIPPGSLVHRSAYQRGPGYQKRLPRDAILVD